MLRYGEAVWPNACPVRALFGTWAASREPKSAEDPCLDDRRTEYENHERTLWKKAWCSKGKTPKLDQKSTLGASSGVFGASASWTDFGLQNPPKMLQVGPRWIQNGAKLGQDGAKMAPSWHPRRILGRSWAIFAVLACPGTPWGGIWDPKTTQNGANLAPKSKKNGTRFRIDFKIDVWPILSRCWVHFRDHFRLPNLIKNRWRTFMKNGSSSNACYIETQIGKIAFAPFCHQKSVQKRFRKRCAFGHRFWTHFGPTLVPF